MLQAFEDWFNTNVVRLKDQGLQVTLTRPVQPTDHSGIYADFDTSRCIARVSVWESGLSDWEVLSISTGERIFWDHCVLQTSADLQQRLEEFLNLLTAPDPQS